jgi:hypothetical protein
MVRFKWNKDKPYISNGQMVANRLNIEVPTTVILFYEGNNYFSMFDKLPTIPEWPPVAPIKRYS